MGRPGARFGSLALSSNLKDKYLTLHEDHVTLTSPFASCLHSQHKRGYIDIVMDLERPSGWIVCDEATLLEALSTTYGAEYERSQNGTVTSSRKEEKARRR